MRAKSVQRFIPMLDRMPLEARLKRHLADVFGIEKFGMNMSELKPGSANSEFHFHTRQEKPLYVLAGRPTLVVGEAETILAPGDCIGCTANNEICHMLMNRSEKPVRVLEFGDRAPGDECHYPEPDFSPFTLQPDDC